MNSMNFEKFDSWPSNPSLKKGLIGSLIALLIIYPIMSVFFMQSGYEMNVMQSQLSFNGSILKSSYAIMVLYGTIDSYRIAQILDYGFMITYAVLVFCLAFNQARKLPPSLMKKAGYILGFGGILAAIFDAIENAFILLTLTDPLRFPDWWAVAHSAFALPKWILLWTAIIWYVAAIIMEKKQ